MVKIPFCFAMSQISFTGRISAVELVIWLIKMAFVLGLRPLKKSLISFSFETMGRSIFGAHTLRLLFAVIIPNSVAGAVL